MYSDLVGMLQQDYFKEYRNYMDLLGVMSPVSRTAAAGGGSTAALDQQLVASRLHAALSRQKSSPLAIEALSQHHRRLDRSHSEPIKQQQPQQQQQHCSSRYKTELCRPYEESGHCRYGEKCQFAHGMHELRVLSRHPKYKTDLCRTFHTSGYCPYGARCHFVHNSAERRAMLLGLSPPDYSSAAGADVATLLLANSPDEGLFHFPTSPSPVGSLASELETLSLGSAGSASGSPPPLSPAPPTTSLPVFSRLRQAL